MELMIMKPKSTFIKLFNRIGKSANGAKSCVCTLVLTMQLSHFLPVTFSLHRHWPVSLLHTSDTEPLAWHWHAVRKKQKTKTARLRSVTTNGCGHLSRHNISHEYLSTGEGTGFLLRLVGLIRAQMDFHVFCQDILIHTLAPCWRKRFLWFGNYT